MFTLRTVKSIVFPCIVKFCDKYIIAAISTILFFLSIILEALQFIVPNRSFEIYDLSANFAGVLVAYFLVKIYKFWSKHE